MRIEKEKLCVRKKTQEQEFSEQQEDFARWRTVQEQKLQEEMSEKFRERNEELRRERRRHEDNVQRLRSVHWRSLGNDFRERLLNGCLWAIICVVVVGVMVRHHGDKEWHCKTTAGSYAWGVVGYVEGVMAYNAALFWVRAVSSSVDADSAWPKHVAIVKHVLGPAFYLVGTAIGVFISASFCEGDQQWARRIF